MNTTKLTAILERVQAVRAVTKHDPVIRIVFQSDQIEAITSLLSMHSAGHLEIDKHFQEYIQLALENSTIKQRYLTVQFRVRDGLSARACADQLGHAIYHIEVGHNHALDKLNKAGKARGHFVQRVIVKVISALVAEVGAWDFSLTGDLIFVNELPTIRFCIVEGTTQIAKVDLDGLSGLVRRSRSWQEQYREPSQVVEILRTELEGHIESAPDSD